MARNLAAVLASLVLLGCVSSPVRAVTSPGPVPAPEFPAITRLEQVLPHLSTGKAGKTLAVFDIDDTLLMSERFYGSDSWFKWQYALPADSPDKVPCVFEIIGINYDALSLVATEKERAGVNVVNGIAVDKLFLTARSSLDRGATVRQLTEAGYALPRGIGRGRDGLIYRWQPSDDRPADAAKAKDAASEGSGTVVSYFEGLFMVDGLDKGKLLRSLFRKLDVSYDRVVLVDDSEGNLRAMRDAMKEAGIEYQGLQYVGVTKYDFARDEIVKDGRAGRDEVVHFLRHLSSSREERLRGPACFPR